MLCEEVPLKHLGGSLVYMLFAFLFLENKLFGIHQTSFLPVEALEFSELKEGVAPANQTKERAETKSS